MRTATEIRNDLAAVQAAYKMAKVNGLDICDHQDYYLTIADLEDELNDTEWFEDILAAMDEADEVFSLGHDKMVISDGYCDRYVFLRLVQTTLGNIYCVQHEDGETELELVDDLLTTDREAAAMKYMEVFRAILTEETRGQVTR